MGTFEDWIALPVKQNEQTQRIAGKGGGANEAIELLTGKFIFVGLVERFDESLLMLRRLATEPKLNLWYRHRRVAPDNSLKRQLLQDRRCLALLHEANSLDIEVYRWVQEDLYPRYAKDYGPTLESDVAELVRANKHRGGARQSFNYLCSMHYTRRLATLKRRLGYYR